MLQGILFEPESDWAVNPVLPNLTGVKEIAVDLETKDPSLRDRGPGWCFRGGGHIIGISLATKDSQWYFPLRHEGGGNVENVSGTLNYTRDLLKRTDLTTIWFNRYYDEGWLTTEDIQVLGTAYDSGTAVPLLDEERYAYSLDMIVRDFLGIRKDEGLLRTAAAAWGVDPKADLWKLPASFAGSYAEQDARLHYDLWQYCKPRLEAEDLWGIFQLETDLIPLLIEMRLRGVRVDLDRAEQVAKQFKEREQEILDEIKRRWSVRVDVWSAGSVAQAFDKAGLTYPLTQKTKKPSFQQAWLESQTHDLPELIVSARKMNKARGTFIENLIYNHQVDGRIHCQFHPLRGDSEEDAKGSVRRGAVTGRFSSSTPSLQVIPARDPVIGPLIRGCFIPEEGERWSSNDYSQQEPRLTVHFAYLAKIDGAAVARQLYREGKADFHQMVADMADIPRDFAKIINLGMFYGMGKNKLARSLGMSYEEAEPLFDQYHKNVPFVRGLSDICARAAARRGYLRTLLGRRRHFNRWEPAVNYFVPAVSHEEALRRVRDISQPEWFQQNLRRAFTYKAMNSLIQGSAADQTKKAMVDCFKEGINPLIQIHDELCFSISNDSQKARIKEIMEHTVTLEVPSVVDQCISDRWKKF